MAVKLKKEIKMLCEALYFSLSLPLYLIGLFTSRMSQRLSITIICSTCSRRAKDGTRLVKLQQQVPIENQNYTVCDSFILIVVTPLFIGLLLKESLDYIVEICLKVFSAFLSHSQVSFRITTYYQKI